MLPANAHKHYDEADTFHCEATLDKMWWSISLKSFHTGATILQAVRTTRTLLVRTCLGISYLVFEQTNFVNQWQLRILRIHFWLIVFHNCEDFKLHCARQSDLIILAGKRSFSDLLGSPKLPDVKMSNNNNFLFGERVLGITSLFNNNTKSNNTTPTKLQNGQITRSKVGLISFSQKYYLYSNVLSCAVRYLLNGYEIWKSCLQ